MLVILFGLFNGLVFLPVILGLLGPMKNVQHPQESSEPNGIIRKEKSKKKSEEIEGEALEMKSLVV